MTTDDAGSAPEADADSTRFSSPATEPAPAESGPPATDRRRGSQARAAWRRWRRSRPFWGGLLLVLSGLELLALPLTGVLVKRPDQAGDLHRHRRRVRRADRDPADRGGHRAVGQPDPPGVLRDRRDRARHHLVPRVQPRRVRPRHAARDHRRGARVRLGSGRARLRRRRPRRRRAERRCPRPAGTTAVAKPSAGLDPGHRAARGMGRDRHDRGGGRFGTGWRRPSRRRRGRAAPDAGGRRDAGRPGGRHARHRRSGQGGVRRSPRGTASSASSACRRRRRPRRPDLAPPRAEPDADRVVFPSARASPSPTPSVGQSGTAAPSATPTPSTSASASPSPSGTSTSGAARQGQEGGRRRTPRRPRPSPPRAPPRCSRPGPPP